MTLSTTDFLTTPFRRWTIRQRVLLTTVFPTTEVIGSIPLAPLLSTGVFPLEYGPGHRFASGSEHRDSSWRLGPMGLGGRAPIITWEVIGLIPALLPKNRSQVFLENWPNRHDLLYSKKWYFVLEKIGRCRENSSSEKPIVRKTVVKNAPSSKKPLLEMCRWNVYNRKVRRQNDPMTYIVFV